MKPTITFLPAGLNDGNARVGAGDAAGQCRRPCGSPRNAFSLVEMLLAIGVVSFAMVSILGLVPVGLTTFRTAMNLSVESGIAQRLASEAQRTDFTNQSTTNALHHFDEQGLEVEKGAAVFTAEVDPPQFLVATGIVPSDFPARSVQIKINNRMAPAVTNSYSIIIPQG